MTKFWRGGLTFWLILALILQVSGLGCGGGDVTATPPPPSTPADSPSFIASVNFEDGTDGVLVPACGSSCDENHNCIVRNDPGNAHTGSWYGECFSNTALAGDPRVMFRWAFCSSGLLPHGPCQPASTGAWTYDFYFNIPQSVIAGLASQPCSYGQLKLWRSRTSIYTNSADFKGWDVGVMGPQQNCGNGDRVDLVCDSGLCEGLARQVTASLVGDVWHHVCIEYARQEGRGNVVVYLDDGFSASITDPNLGDDVEYQGGNIGADTLEVTNDMVFRMRVDDVRWRFGRHCS